MIDDEIDLNDIFHEEYYEEDELAEEAPPPEFDDTEWTEP